MAKWTVDASHTSVGFSVKHMMVSKVKGSFGAVEGSLDGNPEDLTEAKIDFKIDAASINTNNTDRDNHLRSGDFFDTETYPNITFISTEIVKKDSDEYKITGDMTIKDVTKKVTFEVEYEGKGTNPWGVELAAFEVKGKISRKEFGLTWNQTLEAGGVLVGDDIKISIDLQLNPAQ
ncbi:YceI family protein [Sporosarcina soli]|uniref:YceI family protein n=1 Tax=Sporosarcina soli TaxID=334736 RepID=A0ABW0TFU3_9BACL